MHMNPCETTIECMHSFDCHPFDGGRRHYSSHVCGGMHLHLPPTILAMNGFAGSFAVCSISGQLAGSQK